MQVPTTKRAAQSDEEKLPSVRRTCHHLQLVAGAQAAERHIVRRRAAAAAHRLAAALQSGSSCREAGQVRLHMML